MGNEASLPMEMATNFDAEEIKRLGKRFKKLDLVSSCYNYSFLAYKPMRLVAKIYCLCYIPFVPFLITG